MLQTGHLSELQQQQIHHMLLQQQQLNSQANSQHGNTPGTSQAQNVLPSNWPALLAQTQQHLVQNGNSQPLTSQQGNITPGTQTEVVQSSASGTSVVVYSPSVKLPTVAQTSLASSATSVTGMNHLQGSEHQKATNGPSASLVSQSVSSDVSGVFTTQVNNGNHTQMDTTTTAASVTMLNEGIGYQSSSGFTVASFESSLSGKATSVASRMDTSVLSEINPASLAEVTRSPLSGSRDPNLSAYPISSAADIPATSISTIGTALISPFASPHYVMSPTQKLPFPSVSLSPSITQPLTVNPSCLSPSAGFSPPLISPGLLSPNKQIALASPNASKSPFTVAGGGNGLGVPKISLLFDPNEIPSLPLPLSPPLATDKLSPATPSIYVSKGLSLFPKVAKKVPMIEIRVRYVVILDFI